mmetsp:Transcript_15148/g.62085  ORF Transcript_15148/g.62085 Transcript_15148/m.62085 type:complete len:720 (-) Transcript_15148:1212-3371(-)
MKDKLPDGERSKEQLERTIGFVLENFTAMNRLWVRLQYDCPPEMNKLRTKQRRELSLLVGSSIMTISQLRGVDLSLYKTLILPKLLDQIVSCKESLAQEYLMECIVQVFPDEHHIGTLEELLKALSKFEKGVDLRLVIAALTDRLSRFAANSPENCEAVRNARTFDVFAACLPDVVKKFAPFIQRTELLKAYASLLRVVLAAYPDRMDFVDQILYFCVTILQATEGSSITTGEEDKVTTITSEEFFEGDDGGMAEYARASTAGKDPGNGGNASSETVEELAECSAEENVLVQVISMVFEAHKDISDRLKLHHFMAFIRVLSSPTRRKVAAMLLESISEYKQCIQDEATLEKLFVYVDPLISDRSIRKKQPLVHPLLEKLVENSAFDRESPTASGQARIREGHDMEGPPSSAQPSFLSFGQTQEQTEELEMDAGQQRVGRIVHLLDSSSPERLFVFHRMCFDRFREAGEKNLRLTLPPLVFASLRLAFSWMSSKALEQALEMINCLEEFNPKKALRFYLEMTKTAKSIGGSARAYVLHCIERALEVLETRIVDSREQLRSLTLITSTTTAVGGSMAAVDYENLCQSIVKAGSQLLTRRDQCTALCDATELFWNDETGNDAIRVVECLGMAIDSADAVVSGFERTFLYCDIFNRTTTLFELGCNEVASKEVGQLLAISKNLLDEMGPTSKVHAAKKRLARAEKYALNNPELCRSFSLIAPQ